MHARHDRLCALADSLPGAIRWRFCDYEQLLRKELQLLTQPLHVVPSATEPFQCGRDGRSDSSPLSSGAE